MDTTGLEPVASTMSTWRSNQLSYASEQVITIAQIFSDVQSLELISQIFFEQMLLSENSTEN